jgi:hypothetical protein
VAAARVQIKLGIESDDPVDATHGNMEMFSNGRQHVLRQIAVGLLGLLQYRDQGSLFALVFPEDLVKLAQIEYVSHRSAPFLNPAEVPG